MKKKQIRLRRALAAAFLICCGILQPSVTGAGGPENNARSQSPFHYDYTDQLIVKYRNPSLVRAAVLNSKNAGITINERVNALSAAAGIALTHYRFMSSDGHVVKLPNRMTLAEATAVARRLSADPGVEYAEPDRRMFPLAIPNDPQYVNQWHYKSPTADGEPGGANLPGAWDITTGSSSIVVAVVDTGIVNHVDLAGRTAPGYCFISDSLVANNSNCPGADPSDPGDWCTVAEQNNFNSPCYDSSCAPNCNRQVNSSWHGTHVSGTIGAATNNGIGVAGINWTSKILPVRALGKGGGLTSDIVDGMNWAVGLSVPGVLPNANLARVLNLSFGDSGPCSPTIQTAINSALTAGAVVVVAAGNENTDVSGSNPANCGGVISVAATTRTGGRAFYSNFGTLVKIAAPGGDTRAAATNGVLSTLNSGTTIPGGDIYRYYQGTSMAAPHVAGIASLILSVNPDLTPAQVLSRIQSTARAFPTGTGACTTATCGAGIIDASATVTGLNPAPIISSLSPSSSQAGGPAFTLTVNGNNFISTSEVRWNNSPRTTTHVSATQLTATITAADIATAGTAAVTVVNPAPGGGTSNVINLVINNPVPVISSLSPSSSTAGGPAFMLTVNGNNFISTSEVRWNNSPRTTTYVSSTQLTAAITAADIATTGTAAVMVVNPAPGGGTSTAATLIINNPAPVISSLSPVSSTAGGAAFSLTVNGSNFVGGSQIQWNGNNRTTSFISSTQLTAQITAADIASSGTALVTVINPLPGGGISPATSFTINTPPAPAGGGGGCFIATAAFGSPLERHVRILRTFRDAYLLHCAAGKTFIDYYYQVSPPVARIISQSESLRALARLCLMPFIGITYLFVAWGMIPALLLSTIMFLISCFLIRKLYKKLKEPKRIIPAAKV